MSKYSLLLEYFTAFSEQRLDKLSDMFSDDVILQDWEILATGKAQVMAANAKIFDSVGTLQVNIDTVSEDKSNANVIFAEIEVVINNDIILKVVDVVRFDIHNKIVKITAYKR